MALSSRKRTDTKRAKTTMIKRTGKRIKITTNQTTLCSSKSLNSPQAKRLKVVIHGITRIDRLQRPYIAKCCSIRSKTNFFIAPQANSMEKTSRLGTAIIASSTSTSMLPSALSTNARILRSWSAPPKVLSLSEIARTVLSWYLLSNFVWEIVKMSK